MGRASAAHSGRRMYFLISRILVLELARCIREEGVELTDSVAEAECWNQWISARWKSYPDSIEQSLPLFVSPFQDDVGVVVVGKRMVLLAEKIIARTLQYYGIQVNDKDGSNAPFGSCFDLIGCEYDLSSASSIVAKPRHKVIASLTEMLVELPRHGSKLIPLHVAQSIAGTMVFLLRFCVRGALWCNLVYASLRIHAATSVYMVIFP